MDELETSLLSFVVVSQSFFVDVLIGQYLDTPYRGFFKMRGIKQMPASTRYMTFITRVRSSSGLVNDSLIIFLDFRPDSCTVVQCTSALA